MALYMCLFHDLIMVRRHKPIGARPSARGVRRRPVEILSWSPVSHRLPTNYYDSCALDFGGLSGKTNRRRASLRIQGA